MRVATDIGGTFTDLVYYDERSGELDTAKVSTTPPDFERGVMDVLRIADIGADSGVSFFVHGTTVIINALTERTGAVVGLITTEGFRDVLAIGRANRPDLYNVSFRKPQPFVPRHLRLEVPERVDYTGGVLTALDEDAVRGAAHTLRAEGVEAVAVCFLHSWANPAHEQRCGDLLKEELPDVFVTLSHEITREWREYERTSTTVLNAYVQPVASAYVNRLDGELTGIGIGAHRYIMQSNGGVASFEQSRRAPIRMLESGPVGGVMGAALVGALVGETQIIALDIGGTTAKCSLIDGGNVRTTTEYKLAWTPTNPGYPIKAPVVDIVEIGAGGGSIAWLDQGGALRVGPRSAGAVPGPACYGQGGTEPTVTDANLVAGRINPDYFLGGQIHVDVDLARRAIATLADPLGASVDDAALGIIRIANASMVNALKLVSVRRGYDPREFDMVASGGGGSMHAGALMRELRFKRAIVPNVPGAFSAWGMLMTDMRSDWVQTFIARTDRVELDRLNAAWAALEQEAAGYFASEGIAPENVVVTRSADMRYLGQEHTVNIPLPAGRFDGDFSAIHERFHALHEQFYAFRIPDSPIELVNLRAVGIGTVRKPEILARDEGPADADPAVKGRRMVNYDSDGWRESTICERDRLRPGMRLSGPAIVEEPAATTVVFPGQQLRVDRYGNLIVEEA